MRRPGALVLALAIPFAVMGQAKDWRRMERRKMVNQIGAMQLKNGANEVATDPKEFKLFAVAKDGKIMTWQAKDTRGRKLKVTKYEYPAGADYSKEPGRLKVIVVCVEAKDVCYDVQLVPTS